MFEGIKKLLEDKIKKHDEEVYKLIQNVDKRFEDYDNQLEKRLIEFYKEITEKCFTYMENIMKYSNQISLIDKIANKISQGDMEALETRLMKPIIEERIKAEKDNKAKELNDTLNKKAVAIIKKRDELHKEFLELERKRMDTKDIRNRLDTLNWIIDDLKNEV